MNDAPIITSTPLVIDLDSDGIETLALYQGVKFDIDADGDKDLTGWVGSDDGLLVRDINNDGKINDASELFGEETIKADGSKAKDGFEALSELDSNSDGVINSDDELFSELKVWKDSNSDGITNEGELLSLEDAGVSEISLSSKEVDIDSNGNTIGLEGTYKDTQGQTKEVSDVWFEYNENNKDEGIDLSTYSIIDHKIDLNNGAKDNVVINFDEIIDFVNEDNELVVLGEYGDNILLDGGVKSEENKDGKWEQSETKEDEDGNSYNVFESTTGESIVRILIYEDIDINNF